MEKKVKENYVCLYCNEHLEGDEEWVAHLKSTRHGAAEHAHGFARDVSAALSEFARKSEPFRSEGELRTKGGSRGHDYEF